MKELNLTKETPSLDLTKSRPSLKEIKCELSWVTDKTLTKVNLDLDIFAYVLQNGKVTAVPDCVVFFNNKSFSNGAITYPHDNRGNDEKPEELFVKLAQVPKEKDSVELFVFIDKAEANAHDFSCLASGAFTIFDTDSGEEIQKYQLTEFVSGTALHIGTLVNDNGWQFKPIGEAATASPNQVLSALV